MKPTLQCGTRVAAAFAFILLIGCSGDPSDSDVTACVLQSTGHENIGKEQVHSAMGLEYNRTIIDGIQVHNIVPQADNQWLAHVTVKVGARQVGLSKEDAKRTAEMFGWEEKKGFIIKSVDAHYWLMKGSNGFSCSEA